MRSILIVALVAVLLRRTRSIVGTWLRAWIDAHASGGSRKVGGSLSVEVGWRTLVVYMLFRCVFRRCFVWSTISEDGQLFRAGHMFA